MSENPDSANTGDLASLADNPFAPTPAPRPLGEMFTDIPAASSDADSKDTDDESGLAGLFDESDEPAPESSRPKRTVRLGSPTRTRAVPAGQPDPTPAWKPAPRNDSAASSRPPQQGSATVPNTPAPGYLRAPTPLPSNRQPDPVPPAHPQPAAHATPQPAAASTAAYSQPAAQPGGGRSMVESWQALEQMNAARRFSEADRLWPYVDKVMTVAGSDSLIQNRTAELELINDVEADRRQREELLDVLKPKLAAAGVLIPDPNDIPPTLQMAYDELVGISVLGDIWRDPSVTEIMVDRWDRITVERNGRLELTPFRFRNPVHASRLARSLAERVSHRTVSQAINLVTAELPAARVQIAYGPVVKGGLSITIRKFRALLGLEDLRRFGALDDQMIEFLTDCVQARSGVLVSGGTGTGKTTIINLLSNFIPVNERVVTIEDAFELQLNAEHVVSLQTKEASSADDTVSVTLADLLRASLRMRPDRIIVGEIREGEGANVMLAAANTGHDGTMTTIHANSPDMAINERLVDLVRQTRSSSDEAIRRTIANAFDLVVQVSRGRTGNRYISQIAQIDPSLVADGVLRPRPLFTGESLPDGSTRFSRVDSIRPDTVLGRRLEEAGRTRWLGEVV